MTIQLKPEQEQLIGKAIEAGLIHDAEEVVDVGMNTIRRRLQARLEEQFLDAARWSKELHTWVSSHPVTTPLLSDESIERDCIYGLRRA